MSVELQFCQPFKKSLSANHTTADFISLSTHDHSSASCKPTGWKTYTATVRTHYFTAKKCSSADALLTKTA